MLDLGHRKVSPFIQSSDIFEKQMINHVIEKINCTLIDTVVGNMLAAVALKQ